MAQHPQRWRFAHLQQVGQGESAQDTHRRHQAKGDWCDEHGFPESYCPICNPGASPPDIGEPAHAVNDWCVGHGLPESKCTKCNPELVEGFKASGDWCPEHGFPESVCPICNPQAAPAGAEVSTIEARVVRFRSQDIESSVGLETVQAQRSASASTVHCPAHIEFDAAPSAIAEVERVFRYEEAILRFLIIQLSSPLLEMRKRVEKYSVVLGSPEDQAEAESDAEAPARS